MKWTLKLPWVEGVYDASGLLTTVRCKECTTIERRPKMMRLKWDTLSKHEARRMVDINIPKHSIKNGHRYESMMTRHKKNLALFVGELLKVCWSK